MKKAGIITILALTTALICSLCWATASRLSAAVALVNTSAPMRAFLKKPGRSYVQTYFYFQPSLPEDVLFGLDQELIEGISNPVYVKGGDWMSFVALQRTGKIWVGAGSAETLKGVASKERNWKIYDLGTALKPNTWYRLRCQSDFSTRHFQSLTVEGPGLNKTIDLSQLPLDYPNYMPFDQAAMSYYVEAMRGRSLIAPGKGEGSPLVYFDDVQGGLINGDGSSTITFNSDFEQQAKVENQPVTAPVIKLAGYKEGQWYLERPESIFTIQNKDFAHSGKAVGVADARLER